MSYKEITILQLNKNILEDYIRKISKNPMWTIENAYYGDNKNTLILKDVPLKEEIHTNQIKCLKDNTITSRNGLSYKKHQVSYPALKELLGMLIYENGWPQNNNWELV
jgi:hypothetical protein